MSGPVDLDRMTPAEWEIFSAGSTVEVGRLAVSRSSLGPGRLDIEKETFADGSYRIIPNLVPNNLTAEEESVGKRHTARSEAWPFVDGAAAIQAMREAFDVVLKIDLKKGKQ